MMPFFHLFKIKVDKKIGFVAICVLLICYKMRQPSLLLFTFKEENVLKKYTFFSIHKIICGKLFIL